MDKNILKNRASLIIGDVCIVVSFFVILVVYLYGNDLSEWVRNTSKFGDFITVFASIASLSASGLVAYFGYQISKAQKEIANSQKNIAKEKLKLDLFDRRYKIYNVFKDALISFYHTKEEPLQKRLDAIDEIRNHFNESQFLLDQNSFNKLNKIFFNIVSLYTKIDQLKDMSDSYANDPEDKEYRTQLRNEYDDLLSKTSDHLVELPKIFAKYMSFEDLKIK